MNLVFKFWHEPNPTKSMVHPEPHMFNLHCESINEASFPLDSFASYYFRKMKLSNAF